MVFVMHMGRAHDPDSIRPDNVDRRKGFLDIVERLGQGVVAVTPADTAVRNSSDDANAGPRRSETRRPSRP
jgi:hypothetical protein